MPNTCWMVEHTKTLLYMYYRGNNSSTLGSECFRISRISWWNVSWRFLATNIPLNCRGIRFELFSEETKLIRILRVSIRFWIRIDFVFRSRIVDRTYRFRANQITRVFFCAKKSWILKSKQSKTISFHRQVNDRSNAVKQ